MPLFEFLFRRTILTCAAKNGGSTSSMNLAFNIKTIIEIKANLLFNVLIEQYWMPTGRMWHRLHLNLKMDMDGRMENFQNILIF